VPELLTPELIDLRERTARLAAETLVPLRDDATLDPRERAHRVTAASKATGLFGMTQPEELGGTPASTLALVVVRDTLGQYDVVHLPGLFGSGPGVLAGVGEPLRSTHLLPLLAGEKRAGFAFTEPADVARPTWAKVAGDELVVNGQKSYVTGGADADFLTALVEVEGRGPAMVVIDTTGPGVVLTRRFDTLDGSHHAAFAFADARVPRHHLVGAPGEGMRRALDKISEVRLAIAAGCVGVSQWVIEYLTDQLLAPRRRGEPLGSHEQVRLRYGALRVDAYAARSMLYRTARLADAGENVVNEAIACKVFATEAAGRITDAAVQLVGGEALTEGHPLEGVLRRMRVLRLAEGETDTLLVSLARGRLDLDLGRL
jgi:alkylation response protein AidB-like acyl-CoA dehydrogenase